MLFLHFVIESYFLLGSVGFYKIRILGSHKLENITIKYFMELVKKSGDIVNSFHRKNFVSVAL